MRSQLLAGLLPLALAYAHNDEGFALLGPPEPPAPTTAPDAALVAQLLQPRAATADNTCGWVNAMQSNSLTCIGSGQCARDTVRSVFGCCSNLASCYLPTACIDSSLAQYLTGNSNGLTQVCTGSAPHCQTYFGFGGMAGYYGFGCGTQAYEIFLVYPTYSGGKSTAGVVAATAAGGSGGSAQTAAPFNAVGGGTVTGSTASSTGSSSSNSTNSTGGGSGLSTGAIVGIAVAAGVVVIAAIALIAFFVHKRYKNKKLQQQQQPVQYTQVPPSQGPPGPPYQPQGGFYDPGKADVMSQVGSTVHPGQHGGEWDFAKQGVAHYQTAPGPENDGIKVTEIRPDEAVDERHQAMSHVGSTVVAPTAIAPTMVSHHPQGV